MQKYELMIIYKPLLFEDIKNNGFRKVTEAVAKFKGEINEADNLGKKLLAYPIKKSKEGYYVEYELKMESEHVPAFSKQMNLIQDVLRFIVIKK